MKVCITGVAGFIGSHTADIFLEKGHDVVGIDDFSSGFQSNIPSGIDFIMADVTKKIEFRDYQIPDAIVHLAAQPSLLKSVEDPVFDASANVLGTLRMIALAQRHGVNRFVLASTSAVYSSRDTREDTTELFPIRPYGISKLTAERYVRALLPERGVILRYANVYGPRQVPLGENQLIPRALNHIYHGNEFYIYGDGQQTRDFIYVEDVARANYMAVVEQIPDSFYLNVSTGLSYSVVEVLKEIARLTAFTGKFEFGPAKDGERRHVEMPNDLIMEDLMWEPAFTLHEGLKRTVLSYG